MKTPEEIAAIIQRHNLTDGGDVRHLEAQIRRELTVREVLLFADFLHGGKFTSSAGWERNTSGIVTKTAAEDAALARTWEAITASARFYIGAASVLQMQNAQLIGGYAMADEGDGPTLYDFTLDALIQAVPKEYRKRLDTASRLDSIKADTSETAKAVKVIFEKTTKARSGISAATASKIWAILSPADAPTDDTIRNWIKAGHLAKHPAIIIAENHLATKSSFVQWLLGAFENMGKGKHTPTQAQMQQINAL